MKNFFVTIILFVIPQTLGSEHTQARDAFLRRAIADRIKTTCPKAQLNLEDLKWGLKKSLERAHSYIKQAGKIQAEYEPELTSVAAYANYFCRMGTLPRQGNLPPLEEIFRTQELEVRESQPVDLNIAKSLNL